MRNSNRKQNILRFSLTLILVITASIIMYAQPTGPNNSPTPFGFLEALLLGGAVYGGKEVLSRMKKTP